MTQLQPNKCLWTAGKTHRPHWAQRNGHDASALAPKLSQVTRKHELHSWPSLKPDTEPCHNVTMHFLLVLPTLSGANSPNKRRLVWVWSVGSLDCWGFLGFWVSGCFGVESGSTGSTKLPWRRQEMTWAAIGSQRFDFWASTTRNWNKLGYINSCTSSQRPACYRVILLICNSFVSCLLTSHKDTHWS